MSHASGAVLFLDGTIKFFEYNGTVDICQPKLFSTKEELSNNWRTNDWPQCNDTNHIHQKVRIATTYGAGFSWNGFACLDCNCLVSPLEVNYDSEENGLPDWYPIDPEGREFLNRISGK